MDQPQLREKVRQSMERAFALGGDYSILAESESYTQNKRAGDKRDQFLKLTEDLIACIDLADRAADAAEPQPGLDCCICGARITHGEPQP